MAAARPPAAEPAGRRRAWRFGWLAEELCAVVLRLKGYRVLARRWRTAAGEIDIVARRGRVLAFIEVKARRDGATAAEAISARQRRRVVQAAQAFAARHPAAAGLDWRFDAMLVAGWRPPRHIEDAWRPGGFNRTA